MRLPWPHSTVEDRLLSLAGQETSLRIVKLLHHLSHLETVERFATHSNLIADIESVAEEVFALLKKDPKHFDALLQSQPPGNPDD